MNREIVQGPPGEQEICVTCGFCCDGTIFRHAHLNPGERNMIPELLAESVRDFDGTDYFLQPCPYFKGKCSIYDIRRADVCGSYRCQLLKDVEAGRVSPGEALREVADAMAMRKGIFEYFRRLTGSEAGSFRELLMDLGKYNAPDTTGGGAQAGEADLLQARCNIFEALLIRHFRSTDDFDKLIMK